MELAPRYRLVLAGVLLGLAFWLAGSLLDTFFFNGMGLVHNLFFPGIRELWVRVFVLLMFVFSAVYIHFNIKRRTAYLERLKESEELNRAILNTVLDGIITINSDATVVRFNPAAEKIFGYNQSEVIGRDVNMLMPEPYHSEHSTYIKNYLTTGEKKIIGIGREVEGRRKDGTRFPLALAVTEMHLDGRRMFTGILRDITEKKEAEKALIESEAKFRSLAEEALVGIYMVQEGRFVYVNPRLADMLGYSVAELLSMDSLLEIVTPEERALAQEGIMGLLSGGSGSVSYQGHWLRKDGSLIEVEGIATGTTFDGSPAMVGTALDITARKMLERQRADFYAMVTHDLKSPLTAIMGYAELIASGDKADEETRGMASNILQNSMKLSRLVEDFLMHARLESGTMALDLKDVDAAALLSEVKDEFAGQAAKKGLTLTLDAEDGLPPIRADKTQMARALSNLVQNAVNYTPGGGSITLEARRRTDWDAGSVAVSVSDTGPGIPHDEQAKVFEKYYRSKRTAGVKGTGLGLAIVKAVAEAHGGRVELKSEPGSGSTFSLVLPAALGRKNQAAA